MISVVELYFFGMLKSLKLQVSWYFSCMGLGIEPEAECTVGARVDFSPSLVWKLPWSYNPYSPFIHVSNIYQVPTKCGLCAKLWRYTVNKT